MVRVHSAIGFLHPSQVTAASARTRSQDDANVFVLCQECDVSHSGETKGHHSFIRLDGACRCFALKADRSSTTCMTRSKRGRSDWWCTWCTWSCSCQPAPAVCSLPLYHPSTDDHASRWSTELCSVFIYKLSRTPPAGRIIVVNSEQRREDDQSSRQ